MSKNAWIEYVRRYRAANPGLSYKDALVEAKEPYRQRGGYENPQKPLTCEGVREFVCGNHMVGKEVCDNICDSKGNIIVDMSKNPRTAELISRHQLMLRDRINICKRCNTPCHEGCR